MIIKQLNTADLTGKAGILICKKGEMQIDINGSTFNMQSGDVSVVSPILMYPENFVCSEELELIPLLETVEVLFPNVQQFFNTSFFISLLQTPIIALQDDDFIMLLRRIADIDRLQKLEQNNSNVLFQKMINQSCKQLIQSTLVELIAKYVANRPTDNTDKRELAILSKFFLRLLGSKVIVRSVGYYAENLNLSTGYFSSVVRKVLGKSPQIWIEFFVINRAKMMLRKPQVSVKEVSEALGFPEQFTFRKYFKTHTGMSPKEFRSR